MRHKIIVVVGPNHGDGIIARMVAKHHEVYLFEPMPDAAKWLSDNNQDPRIHVVEAACGTIAGRQTFRVYNKGLSSSLGTVTEQARKLLSHADLADAGEFDVEVVNLYEYLTGRGVQEIETLLIDAQGMDLEILKTVSPWLAERKISYISCECDVDGFRHYDGLPSNNESDFHEFMRPYPWYRFVNMPKAGRLNPDLIWELVP